MKKIINLIGLFAIILFTQNAATSQDTLRLNFDELAPGTIVNDLDGATITSGMVERVLFVYSSEDGEQLQLNTPNELYGGTGVGYGGEINAQPLNHIIGMSFEVPEDGATEVAEQKIIDFNINFSIKFDTPVYIDSLNFVNCNYGESVVYAYLYGEYAGFESVPYQGINSVKQTYFAGELLDSLHITLNGATGLDDVYYVSTIQESILPLTLTYFLEKDGYLVWEYTNAVNFDRFQVEYSRDLALGFKKLGDTRSNAYEIRKSEENNYYRLKVIDLDGTFFYSDIIHVYYDGEHSLHKYIDVMGRSVNKEYPYKIKLRK